MQWSLTLYKYLMNTEYVKLYFNFDKYCGLSHDLLNVKARAQIEA